MEQSPQPAAGLAHDAMDSIVAAIASFCSRLFTRHESSDAEIAFTDDWERKQIMRELHLN